MTDRFARRRVLRAALAAPLVVAGVAVAPRASHAAIFPFIPNHYTFSQKDVQRAVARKFPYQRAVAQLFSLTLANPVVALLADANRVAVTMDAHLASPFLTRPVDGALTLSSQLAYDPGSLSVTLKDPSVDRVDVGANVAQYAQQIDAAATLAATQLLANYPIYTFKPEQLQFAGQHFEPGTITILSNGIRVQIVER
jgi:hypothetical protein